MENISEKEKCNFVKAAIATLEEQKKEEVMKCVGQFILNSKIEEINKQIASFQKQCNHIEKTPGGKCAYCGKQLTQIRCKEGE